MSKILIGVIQTLTFFDMTKASNFLYDTVYSVLNFLHRLRLSNKQSKRENIGSNGKILTGTKRGKIKSKREKNRI